MPRSTIIEIERFVRPLMNSVIAHDYKHVDRVRVWAKKLAITEGYVLTDEVEAAALLHDIGLSKDTGRRHAEFSVEMAFPFLHQQAAFGAPSIDRIVDAIRHHSSLNGTGKLYEILQDADGL